MSYTRANLLFLAIRFVEDDENFGIKDLKKIAEWERSKLPPRASEISSDTSDEGPLSPVEDCEDSAVLYEPPKKKPRHECDGKIDWGIVSEFKPCPFNCGKEYASTIGVKTHLLHHHLEEQKTEFEMPLFEFKCRFCNYSTNRRSNLERHNNRYHIDDYYQQIEDEAIILTTVTEPILKSDEPIRSESIPPRRTSRRRNSHYSRKKK